MIVAAEVLQRSKLCDVVLTADYDNSRQTDAQLTPDQIVFFTP